MWSQTEDSYLQLSYDKFTVNFYVDAEKITDRYVFSKAIKNNDKVQNRSHMTAAIDSCWH